MNKALLLFPLLLASLPGDSMRPGGEGTVEEHSHLAFSLPFPKASREEKRRFAVGNSFFRDAWVEAPSSTPGRDGLGPTFNAVSCAACHLLDGRGFGILPTGELHLSLLFRLSSKDGLPHPDYGDQFNPFAIGGVPWEGEVYADFEEIQGSYPDGTPFRLRKPVYKFRKLAFGGLEDALVSPRVAQHLAGLGLLEAVRERDVLAQADPGDSNGDGISGRPQFVKELFSSKTVIGRFGWKAGQPSLRQQNAAAFLGDMGLTTTLFPEENCPGPQQECRRAVNVGAPEVEDGILDRLTFYTQLLAVPSRRLVLGAEQGEKLFHRVNCQGCHTPSFTTGPHEVELLSHQTIFPFTDLLLHDMGAALADHRPEGEASGREWRTPPLWGIGLIPRVNRHSNLLHDGRARSVEEAILWHGGEAEGSKQAFMALSREEREALIQFVNSL